MQELTIADLFAPAPSGVTPGQPTASPPASSWLATIINMAQTVELDVTSWQSGGAGRTLLALLAVMGAQTDGIISGMAQGGFLQFAATGTTTYVAANGQTVVAPVTPDPSIPSQNPSGSLGWLDVLAQSAYNVQRQQPTNAGGTLAVVNTTAGTYTYAAGTYHVVNTLTSASPQPTYSNDSSLSIVPSTSANVTAENILSQTVTLTVSSTAGFSAGGLAYVTGTGTTLDHAFWPVQSKTATTIKLQAAGITGTYGGAGKAYVPQLAQFAADVAGSGSNASAGAINIAVTTNPGVFVQNTSSFVGQDWESNLSVQARCLLKLAALSPSGPGGAYVYFALTASQILLTAAIMVSTGSGQTPVALVGGPITQAIEQFDTALGTMTVTLANASGSTDGNVNLTVTAATAAAPIKVTTAFNHDMNTGDFCYIAGGEGLTGLNGYWQVTKVTATQFTLNGSSGSGSYTTGGIVECGDLGMVDLILRNNALPDGQTLFTKWASVLSVAVSATVYVPIAQVSAFQGALQTALLAYFAVLPIGGVTGVEASNIIPIDAIVGIIYSAGILQIGVPSIVKSVSGVLLNGSATDLSVGTSQVCQLTNGISGIIVVGV